MRRQPAPTAALGAAFRSFGSFDQNAMCEVSHAQRSRVVRQMPLRLLCSMLLFGCLVLPAQGNDLQARLGFYQWLGAAPASSSQDLLSAARRLSTATGAKVFRLYVGARFDYQHPVLSPQRFRGDGLELPLTPAKILSIPRYRAVLEDPAIETVVLTVYPIQDYGGGPNDLNLLRPWTDEARDIERSQIAELCEYLYGEFGGLDKTVIVSNSEADELLLEIANYTGSAELGIENLRRWTETRHDAIVRSRRGHPKARLRLLHAFEISLVNLRIAAQGPSFRKTARLRKRPGNPGWNALKDIVPHVRFDLLSYSAYESANSPFETRDTNHPPPETALRMRRDLDRIREAAGPSLSPEGRARFGSRFVMLGELGYARERFEHLPTGSLLPRLYFAVRAAIEWGCPYVILWQVFDAPREGKQAWGFGMYNRRGEPARLTAPETGCRTIPDCLTLLFSDGFDAWSAANRF